MNNELALEIALRFIPLDRRHALARGASLPDRVHGAAMFADISGFTPLTEMLVQTLGTERGTEELARRLNLFYEVLIRQVDRYGGSVISFSGDALTCWFDQDDGLSATTCGLFMQQALRELGSIETLTGPLALKIAIVTGPARRFVVGDPSIQFIDVLAGATLDRLAETEQHAEKGQVVLDAPTAAQLEHRVEIAEWRAGTDGRPQGFAIIQHLITPVAPQPWPALDPKSLNQVQVRPWLLPSVYGHLYSGQGESLLELRTVVALFLRFGGIDYDADEWACEKLDAYIRSVQRVLMHYDGTLTQLTMGDKGSYLYANLGAPVAHEDDSARAVAAALDLRSAELPFIQSVQIGISRGQMCTGLYGGPTRQTFGVIGGEANLAARLMQYASNGEIIVSQRLVRETGQRFRFDPLGSMRIKGKQKSISIFKVIDKQTETDEPSSAVHQATAPLIGRRAERTHLTEQLLRLARGAGGDTLIIEGEAGIGKTRLVQDLIEQAHALNVTTLVGAGEAIEQSTPYYAWRAVWSQFFRLAALPNDVTARREYVLSKLDTDLEFRGLAPLLSPVLPFDIPDNELTAQMSAEVRSNNLHRILTALLQRAANAAPLLILIEDAHWLDSASWTLLQRIVHDVHPRMLVITLRPPGSPSPAEYGQLLGAANVQHIQLAELPLDEAVALVIQRLGVRQLPAVIADLIRTQAEGHPFFSEELAYALRDRGLILIRDGECRIGPQVNLERITLPDTVRSVITSRIDRLTPSQQLILKVAGAVGPVFPVRLLHEVAAIGVTQLAADLDALEHLELVRREAAEPDAIYRFKHVITQEVAYSLMLFAQRSALHGAIASWYERAHTDNLASYYGLLAHHWEQAGAAPKMIEYAELAGEQALNASAYKEAVAFFSRVLALDAKHTASISSARRARWRRNLGEAYRKWGKLSEAREQLEQGADLYGYSSPAHTGGLPVKLAGEIVKQTLYRLRSPTGSANRTLLLQVAQIYETLSEIYFFSSERLLSLFASVRMLNLAEQAGPSPELARANATMCVLTGLFGLRQLAETYSQRALETAQAIQQPVTQADVLRTTALYRIGIGDWDKVRAQVPQALEVHARLGDRRYWGDSLALLAVTAFYEGDFTHSKEWYSKIATEEHGIALHQIWSLTWQGGIELRQGKLNEAVEFLNTGLALLSHSAERSAEIANLGFLAMARWRQGDTIAARDAADKAALLIKATGGLPSAFYAIDGYIGVAYVYLGLLESHSDLPRLEREALLKTARQVCNNLHAYSRLFPIGQPSTWLYQGLLDWIENKPTRAQQSWHKSLAAAERLQMPYEQGRAHWEIARHLHPGDPARQEQLVQAAGIFTQLGAAFDLAQTQELVLAKQHSPDIKLEEL